MSRRTSPALKKLVIDLPGATIALEVGPNSTVVTECETDIDHHKGLIGQSRILRWEQTTRPRGRRGGITAYGDISGNAIGDYSVVNSGDAIASGPNSFANTGITNGWPQDAAQTTSKVVTIAVPATVSEIIIRSAGDYSPSGDFKTFIKDER